MPKLNLRFAIEIFLEEKAKSKRQKLGMDSVSGHESTHRRARWIQQSEALKAKDRNHCFSPAHWTNISKSSMNNPALFRRPFHLGLFAVARKVNNLIIVVIFRLTSHSKHFDFISIDWNESRTKWILCDDVPIRSGNARNPLVVVDENGHQAQNKG